MWGDSPARRRISDAQTPVPMHRNASEPIPACNAPASSLDAVGPTIPERMPTRSASALLRRVSQSGSELVRRVSRRRGRAPKTAPSPALSDAGAASSALPAMREGVAVEEASSFKNDEDRLRRGTRGLGRSKSEGRQRRDDPFAVRDDSWMLGTRERGWILDDRLGICWDGREAVAPDLTSTYPAYTSSSDHVPHLSPARLVYASTLSAFPVRPPLRTRLSSTSTTPRPHTECEQMVYDWRASLSHSSLDESPNTPIYASTPTYSVCQQSTPLASVPTPRMATSFRSETSPSPPVSHWRSEGVMSVESYTSVESGHALAAGKQKERADGVKRFSLVDEGAGGSWRAGGEVKFSL